MRIRTTLAVGSFAILGIASTALAQAESRPRTGGMVAAPAKAGAKPAVRTGQMPSSGPAAPAQPATIPNTGMFTNINVVSSGSTTVPAVGGFVAISQITYFPTVVLTDGRVLANFGTGRGYEQVLRQCAFTGMILYGVNMAPCWTVDASGRYSVIQQR